MEFGEPVSAGTVCDALRQGKEGQLKLPKGMFRRGSRYYVRLFEGGRDKWVSLGADLAQASLKLERLRSGQPLASDATVAELAVMWLESYVRTSRNAEGHSLATTRVEKYLEPCLGSKKANKVTKDDLRAYRLWLERSELAAQTVAHVLSDARCAFRWAEDAGLIDRSPVPRRLLPRVQERPPDRLSEAELGSVVAIQNPHGFICRLALATGLRWGELCRAQAAHIERGMLVVSQTKSGRVRRVPLSPEIMRELRGRVGRLVAYSDQGSSSFNRIVRRLSGIERFHAHQLRHTFACRWLERGGSLAALQQVLGHSTVMTTQRYAKLGEEAVLLEAARVAGP